MKGKYFFLVFLVICNFSFAQRIHPEKQIVLSGQLKEISGLELYERKYYAINDSGNEPALYVLNSDGKIAKKLNHPDLKNIDWEDLTRDDQGNIYIADIGNNQNSRRELNIYKISFKDGEMKIAKITFSYSEQKSFPPPQNYRNYDAEALVWVNDSLTLFTKNNTSPYTGYCRIYRIPDQSGTYEVTASDSVFLGEEGFYHNSVTAASFSFSNNQLALLTYNHILVFNDFNGRNLSQSYHTDFVFDSFSQKESIVFDDKNNVVVADEKTAGFIGGKMYWYNIRDYMNGVIPYTTNTIERVHLKTKSKGKAILHYFITETGEYELVCFNEDEKIQKHYFLPMGNQLKESKTFEVDFDHRIAAKWILRIYKNKKMVYCNKVTKMYYD